MPYIMGMIISASFLTQIISSSCCCIKKDDEKEQDTTRQTSAASCNDKNADQQEYQDNEHDHDHEHKRGGVSRHGQQEQMNPQVPLHNLISNEIMLELLVNLSPEDNDTIRSYQHAHSSISWANLFVAS